jgi:hypothetical protein
LLVRSYLLTIPMGFINSFPSFAIYSEAEIVHLSPCVA